MGTSDLTTDVPGAEVDDGRPSAANGANGHVAKKRKKQKALAAVVANGHVGKRKRADASDEAGHARELDEVRDARELDEVDEPGPSRELEHVDEVGAARNLDEIDELRPPRELEQVDEVGAARNLDEIDELRLPRELDQVDEVGDARDLDDLEEVGRADELDDEDADGALAPGPPADAGRRARRRARERAKTAGAQPKPRGRAARRARKAGSGRKPRGRAARRAAAARRATPAGRRAELVATAAWIAAAAAEAPAPASSGRPGKVVRRLAALVAILMIPAAVYALVVTDGPVTALPQADAAYLSEQLITADQRVRKQLARLRPLRTSSAIARTRESQLTARSIALEIGDHGGVGAARLRRALKFEAVWLDAVGSVLSNPRSPLRDELVTRDAALRPALAALPSTDGLRRKGGAAQLRDFAKSRIAAKRHHHR